jgi:hypothetical protein
VPRWSSNDRAKYAIIINYYTPGRSFSTPAWFPKVSLALFNPRVDSFCKEIKARGENSDGVFFHSLEDLWTREFKPQTNEAESAPKGEEENKGEENKEETVPGPKLSGSKEDWYGHSVDYWNKQEASVNGVLGGYGDCSGIDIEISKKFLAAYPNFPRGKALDVGAGIGRVTKLLLEPEFESVDLVEPAKELLDKAQGYIASTKLGKLYNVGL